MAGKGSLVRQKVQASVKHLAALSAAHPAVRHLKLLGNNPKHRCAGGAARNLAH